MDPQELAKQVETEVKRIGADTKKAHDDLQRELSALRGLVEETKGQNVETIGNMRSVFEQKLGNFEGLLQQVQKNLREMEEHHDELATAFKRGAGGPAGQDGDKERLLAAKFERINLTLRGGDARIFIDPAKADVDTYRAYCKSWANVALRRDEKAWSPDETKALMVGSDPAGGYLVPPTISDRIIMKVYESSPIRQLATVETIGTDALELGSDRGEFQFGWVGETQARPVTPTSELGVIRIPVHEMYAQPEATQKFLEDATIDVERWMADKLADRFARGEATAFTSGSGINKPRGFLTYPAGTDYGHIQQYPSGAANTFTADALIKLPFSLKEPYHRNAGWLFKRMTLANIVELKDGNGSYLFRLVLAQGQGVAAGDAQNAPVAGMLNGYPVRTADDMPLPAPGALVGAFGDMRRAYTIVDRLGMTTTRDNLTKKPFVLFYTRKRVGGDVVDFDALLLIKIGET